MYLKYQRGLLNHFASIVKLMAPNNILKKGFAIVKSNNRNTSNPEDIKVGSDIEIILSDTKIKTTVKQKTKHDGTEFNL